MTLNTSRDVRHFFADEASEVIHRLAESRQRQRDRGADGGDFAVGRFRAQDHLAQAFFALHVVGERAFVFPELDDFGVVLGRFGLPVRDEIE